MCNISLKTFFDFIDNPKRLNFSLSEFRNNSKLRYQVWGLDRLGVFLNNEYANDQLLNLSWDLSLRAINDKDESLIDDSILLISVENFSIDYRDSLVRLAIVNFACEKLKIKFQCVVNKVEVYSSERAFKYFLEFSKRSKKARSLKSMGLCEVEREGVVYLKQLPPLQMNR